MTKYTFTSDQLASLLDGTIDLFREYMHAHGYGPERAKAWAATDIMDGLDAERGLLDNGELEPEQLTQVYTNTQQEVEIVRRGMQAFT